MASRKIEDLVPEMQELYKKWAARMEEEGIDFIITATRRTQAEQDALYAQGRTAPGRKVTWTRRSKHIGGTAFDFCVMENGKPDWRVDNPKWTRAGHIGEDLGLEWAGSWKTSREFPHFQLKGV